MESKDYTQDGTVDLHGHPALASKTGKWKACAFLVAILIFLSLLLVVFSFSVFWYEAFERMAFYAVASNLVVYLTTQLHEDTVSSVRNVNNWSGSVWMTPIVGAYIAVLTWGMVLLTMAASIKILKPTCINGVCNKASSSQTTFFYSALYILAVGADQFNDFNPHEKKLKVSFFNWWMFSSFIGALLATLGLVYIQDNLGLGLGYGIPTAGLLLSLFIFYNGTPLYRHKVRKTKSPAGELLQVPIVAFANRKLRVPSHPSKLHEFELQHYIHSGKRQIHHSPILGEFLDKAAIKQDNLNPSKPPCSITQVEGAKLILGMAMIWVVTLVPSTIWVQINTLFVKQGTTMDRRLGSNFHIPAASLGSFVTLSMLISVPMHDRYFVPLMRRRTGNPRGIALLQRLGIGFIIQIIAIAIAYVVEVRRIHVTKIHHIIGPKELVPMSILWLLPQYVLLGITDVFNAIGLLEFFYDQSPEDM
ncbi:Protein NRT1/ PTR FAMILY 5.1 [Camellia lanceoleosa]|uniref:Protein NRT1/ PTR FAMILY 5.1 n=1 Tax=Camellia lanceoleosa TaxID=1840588 RepID=A0ACC0FR83_9ERIC|nr:Protein NRT1/ PTR FAMILY 5.1 [Camellia lanceoleosa]